MEQRVLIVDDDLHIRRLLQNTLIRAGYKAVEATTAADALALAKSARPDAILLDLGLPDRDGLEIVTLLHQQGTAAIIVVSARDTTDQKVAALDLGAQDYVTKPFDSEEVLARLRANIRDRVEAQGASALVCAGAITIDLANRIVTRDAVEVHLTRKEFEVLQQLALHPGRVITHQSVLAAVWPYEVDRRIDYLRIVVRNLRQKLEIDPARPALIMNELGIGYRLMANGS
ncbi:response regulator [Xylella taiwanensis]|nr:Fis family transcriptional regulator [Xylella taiwanensis]NBI36762.1 response regulator [Xylella taiwanensis]QKD99520.1 response regulator [Xylella taiwanensis]